MKILDRYIAKNFLYGYFISLFVMIGMFLTIDLFMNLDEFAEMLEELDPVTGENFGLKDVAAYTVHFYSVRCALWYKDMAGMIIVIAAVFSLTRMTRSNELVAVMASGMSLKRILAPILLLSVLLTGLMIADQELLIPKYAYELTRDQDDFFDDDSYDIWFVSDDKGSLFCSRKYDEKTKMLHEPFIIMRQLVEGRGDDIYRVTGKIRAVSAVYDADRGGWVLSGGQRMLLGGSDTDLMEGRQSESIDFYPSNLTAADIPIRKREGFKSLLSLRQLTELENNTGVRTTDMAALALQKHSRITKPIINLIMLMVALPVLVCRDPKAMKTAVLISFLTTLSCFLVVFICDLFATEVFFGQIRPVIWAWAPIFIFFPVAIIEIDSMRT
ncbi:MAG: LptF/LptG family permease [Planctomycetes bacterium]|nr:LptF/LptG family permease [Planctomycetota bacterium]